MEQTAREAAQKSEAQVAETLMRNWHIPGWDLRLDRKHIQRWVNPVGGRVVGERDRELRLYECGTIPAGPANPPELLVIEIDGGRVQMREADPKTGSRWREDKVAIVGSYLPGDSSKGIEPKVLMSTHVATMDDAVAIGRLARLEAERRGLCRAVQVIILGDGGNWIDPLVEREFAEYPRIIDWYHAVEHLSACSKAIFGPGSSATAFKELCEAYLGRGEVDAIVALLKKHSDKLGAPHKEDGPEHPRRILATNVGYFTKHKEHMRYPEYRRNGWPIGSGGVEGAVKQFNKRVKGTEQFWQPEGIEAILALRALLLSGDGRWDRYWNSRPAYMAA
jgi:hypothetical protein